MDDKHLSDAELEKLLREIDVPAHDDAAKMHALNLAESQFAQNVKKIEKSRQGIAGGSRLMDAIRNILIFLTGGQNMRKSYAIAGTLMIGVAGIALVSNYQQLKNTFDPASAELSQVKIADARRQRLEAVVAEAPAIPAAPPLVTQAPPPPPPPPPPAPRAMTTQPDMELSGILEPLEAKPAPIYEAKVAAEREKAKEVAKADNLIGATSGTLGRGLFIQHEPPKYAMPQQDSDQFETFKANPVKSAADEPVSTFSIDVDTSSYAVLRRALDNGQLPPKDAIRVEELINYFDYSYPVPESREEPFAPTVALYETPWNPDTVLMHIGIKGHELPADAEKPRSNLVFLLDVSGSMAGPDRLPLLKQAFRMLVDTLDEDDTISIVTYAGNAGTVLEPTRVAEKAKILNAIDMLNASGATAGGEGIQTAYKMAEQSFDKEGVNRVILATDGDFNVGITDREELKHYIEQKRESGIYLSVLGFGQGNYNDSLMQALAQNGNGNAAYIDGINEARKVLVDEATSTLYPIANDVKIQVEFNPSKVAEYRLIGYETRQLNREDFNNDKVDAGDIGAGHTVTAIYELTPVGSRARMVDDLRYGTAHEQKAEAGEGDSNEYAFLKMRYKLPGEKESRLISRPIGEGDMHSLDELSDDVRFAGAVAAFGQLARGDSYTGSFTYDDVLELATPARGNDPFNYRGEFLNLVRNAKVTQGQ